MKKFMVGDIVSFEDPDNFGEYYRGEVVSIYGLGESVFEVMVGNYVGDEPDGGQFYSVRLDGDGEVTLGEADMTLRSRVKYFVVELAVPAHAVGYVDEVASDLSESVGLPDFPGLILGVREPTGDEVGSIAVDLEHWRTKQRSAT